MAKRGTLTIKTVKNNGSEFGIELIDSLKSVLFEAVSFRETSINQSVSIRVMQRDNQIALDKVEIFYPDTIHVINFDYYVQYKKQWFALADIPANSCNFETGYTGIILSQALAGKPKG